MARRIKVIGLSRPRIKMGRTVKTNGLAGYIAGRTGLNKSEIVYVLMALSDAVRHYHRSGHGVKLEGLGTYLPNVRLDGTLDVQHRLDPGLRRLLNEEEFTGLMLNERNAGKTPDELVAQWNEAHPDDPVED